MHLFATVHNVVSGQSIYSKSFQQKTAE